MPPTTRNLPIGGYGVRSRHVNAIQGDAGRGAAEYVITAPGATEPSNTPALLTVFPLAVGIVSTKANDGSGAPFVL